MNLIVCIANHTKSDWYAQIKTLQENEHQNIDWSTAAKSNNCPQKAWIAVLFGKWNVVANEISDIF